LWTTLNGSWALATGANPSEQVRTSPSASQRLHLRDVKIVGESSAPKDENRMQIILLLMSLPSHNPTIRSRGFYCGIARHARTSDIV
jgi:hypothetical protein